MSILDAAWAEAEAALPEGWSLSLRRVDVRWNAIADGPVLGVLTQRHQWQTYDPDPVVALRAIAAWLRNALVVA